jgi:hypothetical protein
MSLTGADLRARIDLLMNAQDVNQDQVAETLTAGYGYALSRDAHRMRIEHRITELAADAEDPAAARELRKLWLEQRTITAELTELREQLCRLRQARFVER